MNDFLNRIKLKFSDRKFLRKAGKILGILLLVLLVINLGINIFLKNKLPQIIQKNTDYVVKYDHLNVSLLTGGISAENITISDKLPANTEKLSISGTVKKLSASRFGIFSAVFSKAIHSSDVTLENPNLKIILPVKQRKDKAKKETKISFDNINIINGNIQVFENNKRPFFSAKNLGLNIENLKLAKENEDKTLPFTFDEYVLNCDDFFLQPDNVYQITAEKISTENSIMKVTDFKLINLMSPMEFARNFPKKKNLFHFTSAQMFFDNLSMDKNRIDFTKVSFESPELFLFTTNAQPQKKEKTFEYDINLEDLALKNAKFHILKQDSSTVLNAKNLDMSINRLEMNEETAKGNIPISYEDFKINGKNTEIGTAENLFRFASVVIDKNSGEFRNVVAKPLVANSTKMLMDFTLRRLSFKLNEWNLEHEKLKLDADNVLADGFNGTITPAASKAPKKQGNNFDKIQFPLKIRKVELKNSNVTLNQNGKPLYARNLNADFNNIVMDENSVKGSGLPVKIESYTVKTGLDYSTEFYRMTASSIAYSKSRLDITNFAMKPLVSRAQFIKMIPVERDLYDLSASKITFLGDVDLLSSGQQINATQLTIDRANANIFRSKLPKDDPKIKPLYSELLRSIKFPMFIANMDLKNSVLEYEEDTKASEGPGKLTFGSFNMNVKNLNSGKMKGKPTAVPIRIRTRFMNASPMNVNWNFDTANMSDAFTIRGNIADLPASRINPFIEPYLKIRATGTIQDLIFNFNGNKNGLGGTFKLNQSDLKVAVLNKEGKKNKVLSAVANIFVKSDTKMPESVVVDDVKRDPTKSFFNMFWKGIQEGLGKTLIGKNFEANEVQESLKSTSKDVKSAVKDVKETAAVVGGKGNPKPQPKKSEEKKDGGFFNKIFKKKE